MMMKILTALTLLFVAAMFSGCSFAALACDETIKATQKSPDGQYTAICVARDCGATGSGSTLIFLKRNSLFSWGKKLLFDAKHTDKRITLSWNNNRQLIVHCAGCDARDVLYRLDRWKEVDIVYPQLSSHLQREWQLSID